MKELDKINDHKKLVKNVGNIIVDLWKMDAMNFKVLQMLSEYSKAKTMGALHLLSKRLYNAN
jgi:chaperonin cofactor prefoldin